MIAAVAVVALLSVLPASAQNKTGTEDLDLDKLLGPVDGGDEDLKKLPFKVPEKSETLPETALVITTKGPFELKLFRDRAPISVANFRHLGTQRIYEGVSFHRFIPNFVIQGGDPTGTGQGGSQLPDLTEEFNHRSTVPVNAGRARHSHLRQGFGGQAVRAVERVAEKRT